MVLAKRGSATILKRAGVNRGEGVGSGTILRKRGKGRPESPGTYLNHWPGVLLHGWVHSALWFMFSFEFRNLLGSNYDAIRPNSKGGEQHFFIARRCSHVYEVTRGLYHLRPCTRGVQPFSAGPWYEFEA